MPHLPFLTLLLFVMSFPSAFVSTAIKTARHSSIFQRR